MATAKKKAAKGTKSVVWLNLAGPITILGCAAQGCTELILGGLLPKAGLSSRRISTKGKKRT